MANKQPLPACRNAHSFRCFSAHRVCKSYEAYAAVADNGGGKIVGVSFVDVHAKGSRLATLGPVSSLAPGAGRMTFVAACDHAEKLGFSTLVRAGPGPVEEEEGKGVFSMVPSCLLAWWFSLGE